MRVCGEETVTLKTKKYNHVYKWINTAAPLYDTMDQIYMTTWFWDILPVNDPCVLNDVKMGTEYQFIDNSRLYTLTPWPASNIQTVLTGSWGSY